MGNQPIIRRHLLWEYNWEKIDFTKLAIVVIERVIERGNFNEWREIIRFYGKARIEEITIRSTRLDQKNKHFTPIFLQSDFIN